MLLTSTITLWTEFLVGTGDETVQVSGSRAAFSLALRNHYFTLPGGKTFVGLV